MNEYFLPKEAHTDHGSEQTETVLCGGSSLNIATARNEEKNMGGSASKVAAAGRAVSRASTPHAGAASSLKKPQGSAAAPASHLPGDDGDSALKNFKPTKGTSETLQTV